MSGLCGIHAKGINLHTKFICKCINSVNSIVRTAACNRSTSRFISTASQQHSEGTMVRTSTGIPTTLTVSSALFFCAAREVPREQEYLKLGYDRFIRHNYNLSLTNVRRCLLFPTVQKSPVDHGLLIVEILSSYSDTLHSIGLIWMSDQPDAETYTRQHKTLTRDRYSCPRPNSNSESQQASGRSLTPWTARPLESKNK